MMRILRSAPPPFDPSAELVAEHKRRATYSSCYCPYCAAIKTYVSAKLQVRRIEREDNHDTHIGSPRVQRLEMATRRLDSAWAVKEAAKRLPASALGFAA
jgi:hypothetical protein